MERELAESWLDSGSLLAVQPRGGTRQPYPKRSELRRAEARAASRRGGDRRPAGSRPPGGSPRRHGPPAPSSGARASEPTTRRPIAHQGAGSARLPVAVSPRPAVLPIPQTSGRTRPAGIDVPLPAGYSTTAFRPPAAPMVPIAVPLGPSPAGDGAPAPIAPSELTAPLSSALEVVEAAEWGLELAGEADADAEVRARRPSKTSRKTSTTTGGRTASPGRGRASMVRMLVLALVVGAEGVAITQLPGTAHTAPVHPSTAGVSGAFALAAASVPSSVVLEDSAQRQQAAVAAQNEALALEQAQGSSSDAKVTSALAQAKAAADRVKAAAERRARAMRDAQRNPQAVARLLAADRGWGSGQFSCLVSLWNRESRWNYRAYNPSSGAYGIPQALPGSKMGSVAADWRTNPVTQIRWGLNYIADRYGTPCGAWGHSQATGWY
jgi:hypothetical protein